MAAIARSVPEPSLRSIVVHALDDDEPLAATHFAPPGGDGPPRGAILVVPAMGVPQSFYAPFCAWLAERGYYALTFDYRGTGASRRGRLRDVDADIVTWAERDAAGALRWLEIRAAGLPITWIGHSLGGQILPFVRDRTRLAKAITVAAGSGYWRENVPQLRRKVWLLWYGAAPIATALFGYFPGKRLGMVGDLPRGVIRQWRRWCLDPGYAVGAEGEPVRELFARVTTPIASLSFTDDEMMSAANIVSLHGAYANAPIAMKRIAPADVGLTRIGHFGAFKRDMRAVLWEPLIHPELATAGDAPARSPAAPR